MAPRLVDGDRVCIIGGGPSGSFAALHLLEHARRRGLRLEILVFEPKDPGGGGRAWRCKGCAGVLSNASLLNLESLDLQMPESLVQSRLARYTVHLAGRPIDVVQPKPAHRIVTVYRGSGPRLAEGRAPSFDAWLLDAAVARGAVHLPLRVDSVEAGCDGRMVLVAGGQEFTAALVLLATGVNAASPLAPELGYRPPKTARMEEDELPRPECWPSDTVVGFFAQPPGLVFGAMVPKGKHLNVTLLWREGGQSAAAFYNAQSRYLPGYCPVPAESMCGCKPRIPVNLAGRFYGDRWAAVGDAATSRLYKDGINSAFLIARAAAQAAVEEGVGEGDFTHYLRPTCDALAADNRLGELLYAACDRSMRWGKLARAVARSVGAEGKLPAEKRIYARFIWGMLTGDESYASLYRLMMRPSALIRLARSFREPRTA